MSSHIDKDGKFQSDKYPTTPPDCVPLKVTDPTAQDLLWTYAERRRAVDAEFADDLQRRLREVGYDHPKAITKLNIYATLDGTLRRLKNDIDAGIQALNALSEATGVAPPKNKTVTVRFEGVKDPDAIYVITEGLGLSREERDTHFRYGDYADIELIVDDKLAIVGGRFLPDSDPV